MTQAIDKGSRATVAALTAQAALDRGDTQAARKAFAEAGEILEREGDTARDEGDQALAYFLSSTQYYKGGHYARARDLFRKIKQARLPGDTRRLLPPFLKDVDDRASPDFGARVRARISELTKAGDYARLLEVLADHASALHPDQLAFLRGVCCENLGDYRPATLFFADAARWAPGQPAVLARLAEVPLRLAVGGDMRGAWEYVNAQSELFPNPVSKVLASLLYKHDADRAELAGRASLRAEQERLFREAKEDFALLPDAHRADHRIKAMMQMGYRAAALALYSDGKKEEALATCDEAVAAAPELPHPWTLTGVMNEDPAKCIPAFRKAISLGEDSFFPYVRLAFYAVKRSDFAEALEMATEALKRGGGAQPGVMKSMLLQWQAISLVNLGGSRDEADQLFREALDAAPDNEYAQKNYQRFLQDDESEKEEDEGGNGDGRAWWIQKEDDVYHSINRPEWEFQSAYSDRGDSQIEKMLAGVS